MSPAVRLIRAPDVAVIGAGLIGLAIALELSNRGATVTVIDRGRSLSGASTAAAGMLAAEDPGNPPELQSLSRLSIERYPAFLQRIEALSGLVVPFQTDATIQYHNDGTTRRMAEHSLDPRQLAVALRSAVNSTPIRLLEDAEVAAIEEDSAATRIHLSAGETITTQAILFSAGAWTSEVLTQLDSELLSVTPRRGQMLRVHLPFPLNEVHRCENVYIVPRTRGPQAGTALLGATVEDAGFDTSVHSDALRTLRALAAELFPGLASEVDAPMVESWAGLRPTTPDRLPVLGACSRRGRFMATGHYRNGILQAPATALVMADLLEGRSPSIDVSAFSPLRFGPSVLA
jgi:glycine oxidase